MSMISGGKKGLHPWRSRCPVPESVACDVPAVVVAVSPIVAVTVVVLTVCLEGQIGS